MPGCSGSPERFTGLDPTWLPIDLTRENEHESKREFLLERNTVKGCLAGLEKLFETLVPTEPTPEFAAMRARLTTVTGDKIRAVAGGREVKDVKDLMIKNAAEGPAFINHFELLLQLQEALGARLQELEDQEKEFWSDRHRAPNHYARTIALRLARLHARELGKRPTYGTSSQGRHASTDYTRALETIYEVLGIKGKIVPPAKWAIAQLTDADFRNDQKDRLVEALLAQTRRRWQARDEATLDDVIGRPKGGAG